MLNLVKNYEYDLFSKCLEAKTVKMYSVHVRTFLDLNEIKSLESLNKSDYLDYHPYLDRFTHYIRIEKKLSQKSINSYFCALDAFFDYLVYYRYVKINPVPLYRKRFIRYYKPEEPEQSYVPNINEMIEFLESINDLPLLASLVLGSKCMLRRNEMLTLKYSSVDVKRKIIVIEKHKKRNNNIVFFDDEVKNILKKVLNEHARETDELFTQTIGCNKNQKYSTESYRRKLIKYAINAGLYQKGRPLDLNFTYNSCRRFGTTELMKTNMPGPYISYLRGDILKRSSDIKEIYFNIDNRDVQKNYEKYIFKFNLKF